MAVRVGYQLTTKPTFRALNGRFNRADKVLLVERRKELKIQAQRFVKLAKEEAPKRTGEFASNIRFRTFQEQTALGFRVSIPDPLGTFITEGTEPHPIVASRGKVLAFVPKGGSEVVFAHSVNHPGTKPNRFMGRASRRWHPGARKMLARISLRYASEIVGSKSR